MPISRNSDMVLGTVDELLAAYSADKGGAGKLVDSGSASKDGVLIFHTQKDGRVRPEHAALEGRVWELDDADAPSPPLAPNCRCYVEIIPREQSAWAENTTPAESLATFNDLGKNLEQVYPADVVDAFSAGDLKASDLIIKRTGDRITTDQARAIIASRQANADPKAALKAVAELADKGLSGRVLSPIVKDARERMAAGASAHDAARQAIMATPKRGYITAKNADDSARSLVRSRLLDGGEKPPPEKKSPAPTPKPAPPPPPAHGSRAEAEKVAETLAKLDTSHGDTYRIGYESTSLAEDLQTGATVDIPASRNTRDIQAGIFHFRRIVSSEALPDERKASVIASRTRREFARPELDQVHLAKSTNVHTTVHELGHLLERDPAIKAAAQAFLARRTQGEKAERLRDVTGNRGYSAKEITKKDGFFSPYIGKQYDSGYTEVISMGLEKMATDPVGFAKADPDHFRFIYQLARGILEP
jgi:hypothetical protein